MNSTKHTSTKFSPAELLFAGASRVNDPRVFSDEEQSVLELTYEEYSKWMNDRLACQRVRQTSFGRLQSGGFNIFPNQ
jgi:hypothetical protein